MVWKRFLVARKAGMRRVLLGGRHCDAYKTLLKKQNGGVTRLPRELPSVKRTHQARPLRLSHRFPRIPTACKTGGSRPSARRRTRAVLFFYRDSRAKKRAYGDN